MGHIGDTRSDWHGDALGSDLACGTAPWLQGVVCLSWSVIPVFILNDTPVNFSHSSLILISSSLGMGGGSAGLTQQIFSEKSTMLYLHPPFIPKGSDMDGAAWIHQNGHRETCQEEPKVWHQWEKDRTCVLTHKPTWECVSFSQVWPFLSHSL